MEGESQFVVLILPSDTASAEIDGSVAYEAGNYNILLKDCPAYQKCNLYLYQHFFIMI